MVQAEQWIPIGHYVVDYILGILEWSEHDERTDRNKRGGGAAFRHTHRAVVVVEHGSQIHRSGCSWSGPSWEIAGLTHQGPGPLG